MVDSVPVDPQLEISVASRGYSKGVAQTEGPQAIVRPELRLGSASIAGYAKNVSSADQDGEAGVGIGYRKQAGSYEIFGSATAKTMLNPRSGVDARALEMVLSVSRTEGRLLPRLSLTWSPDDLGSTGRSAYWEAGLGGNLNRRMTASAAVGARFRTGGPDYVSMNAGVTYRLLSVLSADLRWYQTTRGELGEPYKGRLVGTARARF